MDKSGLPMVINPIYEQEVIYEEIPGQEEEGYIPITSPVTNGDPPPGKCNLVHLANNVVSYEVVVIKDVVSLILYSPLIVVFLFSVLAWTR